MSEPTEQELEKVKETLTLVRIDLGRLDTKLDMIRDMNQKLEDVGKTANRSMESTLSAHHRLDDLRDKTLPGIEEDMREMRTNYKWMIGTTLSVAALFLTAIGVLWSLKH